MLRQKMKTKKTKPFFESTKHPGLVMNRFGVVMGLKSDPRVHRDLWQGVDWTHIPLRYDRECRDAAMDVQEEAYDHGYTWNYVKGERVYSKPAKPKFDKPSLGLDYTGNGTRLRNVQFLHNRGGKVVAFASVDFENEVITQVMCVAAVNQSQVIDEAQKFLGIRKAEAVSCQSAV